jgi:hypothetical protein
LAHGYYHVATRVIVASITACEDRP